MKNYIKLLYALKIEPVKDVTLIRFFKICEHEDRKNILLLLEKYSING